MFIFFGANFRISDNMCGYMLQLFHKLQALVDQETMESTQD